MTLWHLSANNTHLYPGALLRCQDAPGSVPLVDGDGAAVEFADGALVSGTFGAVDSASAVLTMQSYRTCQGTSVAARDWQVVPGGKPGLLRVQRRL